MANRPQAGTLVVNGAGIRITSETVKEHKDDVGNVIYRELVGFEVRELWPGAAQTATAQYLCEPSNEPSEGRGPKEQK